MIIARIIDNVLNGGFAFYKRNSSMLWDVSDPAIVCTTEYALGLSVAMTSDAQHVVASTSTGSVLFQQNQAKTSYVALQALVLDVPIPNIVARGLIPSVAIQPTSANRRIVVGYPDSVGVAFVFDYNGSSFVQVPGYLSTLLNNGDFFGLSVAVSDNDKFVIGAFGVDTFTGESHFQPD